MICTFSLPPTWRFGRRVVLPTSRSLQRRAPQSSVAPGPQKLLLPPASPRLDQTEMSVPGHHSFRSNIFSHPRTQPRVVLKPQLA